MANRKNYVYTEERDHICIIDKTNSRCYHLYDSEAYKFKRNQAYLHIDTTSSGQLCLQDVRTNEYFFTEDKRVESSGGEGGGGGIFAVMLLAGFAGVHDITYYAALGPAIVADMASSFPVGSLIAVVLLASMLFVVRMIRMERTQDSDLSSSMLFILAGTILFGIISLFVLRFGFKSEELLFNVDTVFSFHAIGVAFDVVTSIVVVFILWTVLFMVMWIVSSVLLLNMRLLLKSLGLYLILASVVLFLYPLASDILGDALRLSASGLTDTATDFLDMLTNRLRVTQEAQIWLNKVIFSKKGAEIRRYALYGLGSGVVLYMLGIGFGRLQEYIRKVRFEKQKPKDLVALKAA